MVRLITPDEQSKPHPDEPHVYRARSLYGRKVWVCRKCGDVKRRT